MWGNYMRLIELRTSVLDESTEPRLRASNLASLAACYQVLGEYDTAVRHYEQAVDIASKAGDSGPEAEYVGNLGRVYRNLGYLDKAVSCSSHALDFYRAQKNRGGEAIWSDRLALGYWNIGRLDEAAELGEAAIDLSMSLGDRRTQGAALSNAGLVYQTWGRDDRAEAAFAESLAIVRQIADRRGEAIALGRLGTVALAGGDAARAFDLHSQALAIAQALGERREQSYQLIGLGRALMDRGDLAQADVRLRAARDLDVPETSYSAALALSLELLYREDREAAGAAFDDAIQRCRQRLGRCNRLYGTRYAMATAMVGAAACSPEWSDDQRREAQLDIATIEYRRAMSDCRGRGAIGAALRDLAHLRKAGIVTLEPMMDLLQSAFESARDRGARTGPAPSGQGDAPVEQ
jgi:tetratricopeptide (TPR) repeat protein